MTTPGWYARGPKGTSISAGTGAPSGGNDGDVYIRTSNGDVYSKASGTWSVVGNIRGPVGATPTLTDLGITADATELNYVDGVTSSIQTQLNGKQAALGFTPENTANKGVANGYASLDSGGKLTAAQVPDIALVQFLGTVANQTAMLALTGQIGDWCIRSDTSTVFILNGNSPSVLGNWTQMVYPAAPVASVAGKTGAVTLVKADVGLGSVDNTADAAKNVLSATKLTTARTINGVSFDGTANITVADSTKEPAITAGTSAQYWRGDKTMQTLDKTAVGLGNVTNNPQYYPGGTDVAVADGGTGASTASAARSNLGLGSLATVTPTGTADNTTVLYGDNVYRVPPTGGGGTGDVVGPAASVDTEVAVFSGTTGKSIKRATTTGLAKMTSGVLSAAVAGTDYATPLFVNVKDFGAKGDNSTDDTTAINNAISGSPVGATIFFPAGTYLISNRIVLYPNRQYVGAGAALGNGASTLKQKNGTNLTGGLLVAQAWNTNAAVCDYPVLLQNICVDGNSANNATSTAHGIVLTNFWARVIDCAVFNVKGDGIRLTDTTANGTNIVSNSCSENVIRGCKLDTIGGDGIRNVSGNGNSNMDGFCVDNLISTVTGNGILLDKASGWVIRRNHLYGIGVSGIDLSRGFATLVEGNYIEDFGLQASNGVWYSGITLTQLDGRGSHIVDNFIGTTEPSASVGAYVYLLAKAGSSQTDAKVIVANNLVNGPASPTNKGYGLYFDVASGGTLRVYDTANHVKSVNTLRQTYAGVLLQAASRQRVLSTASSATPSIDADSCDLYSITALAAAITSVTITGTPADGQKLLLRIKDNGTARALAFGSGIVASGAAALPTTTVAGKTHHIGLTYDAAAAKWVALAVDSTGY